MFSVFSIPNTFQSNLKMIDSPEGTKNKSKGSKRKRSKSRQVSESQGNQIVDTQQEAPAKFEKVTSGSGQKPPFKKSKKNKFNKERSDLNLNNISQEFKSGDEADVVAPKANKKKRKHTSNDQAENPESKVTGNEPNLIAPKTKKSKKHKQNRNELDSTNKKSKTHKHAFQAENTKSNEVDSSESEEQVYVNKEFPATTTKHKETGVEIFENKKSNPDRNNPHLNEELNSRTLFVGNMAATIKKKQLMKFFSKFGKVQSVRLRCATPVHPGVTKRVAVIKRLIHPKRTTLHSYIRFEKREDALEGLKANGTQYKGHHLRVQICSDTGKPDAKKAVFVGNLPFDAEDDDLWAALESCGKIQSVRVVRNAATGMGIGVGYVNFESPDSVELALQLENVQIKNKVVRIKRYQERKPRKEKDNRQVKPNFDSNKPEKATKRKDEKQFVVPVKKTAFQGSQSNIKKKKHKVNKDVLLKFKMSQKIAPRPVQQ